MYRYFSRRLIPCRIHKMRLGLRRDGGYVVPIRSVSECKTCFSYGIGEEYSFEEHLLKLNPEMTLKGFDREAVKPSWATIRSLTCYQDFIDDLGDCNNVLLKMDIESGEWPFFETLNKVHFADRIHTFVCEIHLRKRLTIESVQSLDSLFCSHHLVHVHSNNFSVVRGRVPQALELTFIAKKVVGDLPLDLESYPVPGMDFKNNPNQPDLPLHWLNQ